MIAAMLIFRFAKLITLSYISLKRKVLED